MSWFHEPLITPATAFFCFLALIVMDGLYLIVRKAMRDGEVADPMAEIHGDVPRDGRRG